jgi:large subunit ribosomal protein L18
MAFGREEARERRRRRVRGKIFGTAERPRLNVFRSLEHIYAQIIDDEAGHTLAAASSTEKVVRDGNHKKSEEAVAIGKLVAERAAAKQIKKVVFDRAGYRYHGRIKAIADGAREGGLEF